MYFISSVVRDDDDDDTEEEEDEAASRRGTSTRSDCPAKELLPPRDVDANPDTQLGKKHSRREAEILMLR